MITVDDEDAFEWGRKLAKHEGIVGGISSGANMWASAQVAARPDMKGKRIVTIMCSLGERYLSTPPVRRPGTLSPCTAFYGDAGKARDRLFAAETPDVEHPFFGCGSARDRSLSSFF